jgi:hypothetical protein
MKNVALGEAESRSCGERLSVRIRDSVLPKIR